MIFPTQACFKLSRTVRVVQRHVFYTYEQLLQGDTLHTFVHCQIQFEKL